VRPRRTYRRDSQIDPKLKGVNVSQIRTRARFGAVIAAGLSALSIAACGGSGLSASSTCSDFMNASSSDQQAIIDQLAGQYNKPDYTTPLGEPEVPYYCSSNPNVTLGQFFQNAQG
jgi:hypothetical protein